MAIAFRSRGRNCVGTANTTSITNTAVEESTGGSYGSEVGSGPQFNNLESTELEEEMALTGSSQPRTLLRVLSGHGRMAQACLLAVVLLTFNGLTTSASIGWCRSDPVLYIDNAVADVFVSIPSEDVTKVNGPTQFVITTSPEVESAVLLTTPGFGYGETATIMQSPSMKTSSTATELRIRVYIPATSGTIPVIVEFAPRVLGILAPASAEGTTNQWITLKTSL
jgi:hypothetical protein